MATMLRLLALDLVLHLYIGLRILPSMPGGPLALALVLAAIAASATLLPLAVTPRRAPRGSQADRRSFAGLVAAGAFSSLLVLTLVRDVVLIAATLLPAALVSSESLAALRSVSAAAVPALAGALTLLGYWNARRVPRVAMTWNPRSARSRMAPRISSLSASRTETNTVPARGRVLPAPSWLLANAVA